MTLASIADVKRVLQRDANDTSVDDALTGALEVATEHVQRYMRQTFGADDPGTMVYFDVREDGIVPAPAAGSTLTRITFFRTPTATGYVGVALTDYELHPVTNMIRLHPTFFDVPFEGAVSEHIPENWARVVIDYTLPTPNPVSATIRDAVALTAAAIYTRGPTTTSGLTSETIGDYSYSSKPLRGQFGASEAIPEVAKALLRPLRRRTSLVP